MSIALLQKQFGPDFFKELKANGARVGKGSGQVIDDTASGELSASLAVDYITNAMEEYMKRIQRFEAALPQKQTKWDDDIVSEEATSALFAIMQKSLLKMLPVAILRGSARNPSFYEGLLAELNQYLQQCGVYTLLPSSKEYFDTEDCNFMEILPLPTKNHADDKRVESEENTTEKSLLVIGPRARSNCPSDIVIA